MTAPLFVGVDAGGTKTAALAEAGDRRETLSGPGAQAARDGADAAAAVLATIIARAREAFPDAPLGGVAVGLAGAGRSEVRAAVADALPLDAPLAVTHDADIAYRAAWGGESGALLIVGTGSVVLARSDDGEAFRAGGWGPTLGDDASGAALGRAALRALLATLDGGPPSALPELAAESFGLASAADVMAAVYDADRPLAEYAALLLAAVEAGDWAAESALRTEANALARQAGWLATRAGDTVRHRLAATGGLSGEPAFWSVLSDALARHLPGWEVSRCDTPPAEGALALAKTLG